MGHLSPACYQSIFKACPAQAGTHDNNTGGEGCFALSMRSILCYTQAAGANPVFQIHPQTQTTYIQVLLIPMHSLPCLH